MGGIRHQMRAWSAMWVLAQFLTLAAFVPRDCCAAHGPHKAEASEHCPMHKADGVTCAIRGTCNGPLAALAALLSNPAIPPEVVTFAPDLPRTATIDPPVQALTPAPIPPDTPPPRA